MTLPTALRAIADRIEEAERIRRGALQQLLELAGDKVDLVDGWEGIESPVSPAGAEGQAAGAPALGTPAPTAPSQVKLGRDGARSDVLTCPDCNREFKRQGYAPHRARVHGDRPAKPADRTNGAPPAGTKDARVIRERCPRCDQLFT